MGLVVIFAIVISLACIGTFGFSTYFLITQGLKKMSIVWGILILVSLGLGSISVKLLVEVFFPKQLSLYKLRSLPDMKIFDQSYQVEEASGFNKPKKVNSTECRSEEAWVKITDKISDYKYSEEENVHSGHKLTCPDGQWLILNLHKPQIYSSIYRFEDGEFQIKSKKVFPYFFDPSELTQLADKKFSSYRINNPAMVGDTIIYSIFDVKKGHREIQWIDLKSKKIQSIDVDQITSTGRGEYRDFQIVHLSTSKALVIIQRLPVTFKVGDFSGHNTFPGESIVYEIENGKFEKILSVSHKLGYLSDWYVENGTFWMKTESHVDPKNVKVKIFQMVKK